jgi:beta-galactosidase
MRRFFSGELVAYLAALYRTVKEYAPRRVTTSNHWAEHPAIGFDYLASRETFVEYPGLGFYPGINPEYRKGLIGACFFIDHRIAETGRPAWCLEFQTGTFGGYAAPPGALRMYAWLALLYRSQVFCAWTWRTMLGGEEQYLFGLLDHDGFPGRKYDEWKRVAQEFERLGDLGFPRKTSPEIALAFSFESGVVAGNAGDYYKPGYQDGVLEVFGALFDENLDCNVISLKAKRGESPPDPPLAPYRLIIVPGLCLMDAESAVFLRDYVEQGGAALMTAYSAKVNENNTVFDTPLPGRLHDVFGIKVRGFERTAPHLGAVNEGGIEKQALPPRRNAVGMTIGGVPVEGFRADYYERLECAGAGALGFFTGPEEPLPALTENRFGKGRALYSAVPPDSRVLKAILARLYQGGIIRRGPASPPGVAARFIDDKRILYVNTTGEKQPVPGGELEPYGVEYAATDKSHL